MQRLKDSLSKWFDTGDSKYQAVMKGVDELSAIEIQVEVPDITGPWSTLRMLRSRPPGPPPAAPQIEEQATPVGSEGEEGQG